MRAQCRVSAGCTNPLRRLSPGLGAKTFLFPCSTRKHWPQFQPVVCVDADSRLGSWRQSGGCEGTLWIDVNAM